jgi:PDZ domain-containing secreted protein
VYLEEEVSIYKVAERKNALGEWEEFDCIAKGKFEEGDILKTIQIGNGEIVKITRDFTVREYLLNVRMGDTVKVFVERNGKQETVVLEFNAAKYFTDK